MTDFKKEEFFALESQSICVLLSWGLDTWLWRATEKTVRERLEGRIFAAFCMQNVESTILTT